MNKFWSAIAKYATKVAVYAVDHPDQVIAIVTQVKGKK